MCVTAPATVATHLGRASLKFNGKMRRLHGPYFRRKVNSMKRTFALLLTLTAFSAALPTSPAFAQEVAQKAPTADAKVLIKKAVDFLRTQQADDGSFSSQTGVGPTALVAAGLLSVDVSAADPVVSKAIAYLLKHAQADGGIYATGSRHQNYDSCIAMVALSKANKDGRYTEQLKKLEAFVKKQQWDEGEDKKPDDAFYGGAGYGSKARPDLSNTGFLIEALHELGRDGEDEAIQRALLFVTRCQNLESPQNNTPAATKVNDGGFFYTLPTAAKAWRAPMRTAACAAMAR